MKRKRFKSYRALQAEIDFLQEKIKIYQDSKPAFVKRLNLILSQCLKIRENWKVD